MYLEEATFRASIEPEDYQKIRSASMKGNFTHKFERKTNGDTTFKTTSPKRLAADLESLIPSGENSWMEILGVDAAEIKSKGKTKQTHFHMEAKHVVSADRKPEQYTDKNGKKKYRMVAVNKISVLPEGAVPAYKKDANGKEIFDSKTSSEIMKKTQEKLKALTKQAQDIRQHAYKPVRSVEDYVDAINELSKGTLNSYLGKAIRDRDVAGKETTVHYAKMANLIDDGKTHGKKFNKTMGKYFAADDREDKRIAGINKATVKLRKESTENIDELSQPLLKRYVTKADNDRGKNIMNSVLTLSNKNLVSAPSNVLRGASKMAKRFDDKVEKRIKGMQTTTSRMTKESSDGLIELSQSHLNKYLDKSDTGKNRDDGRKLAVRKLRLKNSGSKHRKVGQEVNESLDQLLQLVENAKLAAQLAARKAQRQRMKDKTKTTAVKKAAVAKGEKPVAKPTVDKGKNAMDDRHIIMQLRSAQDLEGNKEIQFRRGTGKLDINTINTILKVHDRFTKPNDKRRLFIAVSKSAEDAKKTADKFKKINF